jgi:predicted AAA+ superfamily ATPase
MELSKLRFQNKHWDNLEALREDIHLKQLLSAPLILRHPVEEKLRLNEDKVYIIRGPRQIGKTSLAKRKLKGLIDEHKDPKRAFYFAFDIGNIKDDNEVAGLIHTYINLVRKEFNDKRLWLFLDEVTYTPNWATGIKRAYDSGLLQNTTLIVTGSSALDLIKGGERLPGRRGTAAHENDLDMFPLSFRAYVDNLYGIKDLPYASESGASGLYDACLQASYYEEEIGQAFEEYLLCGGFPLSILGLRKGGEIEPSIYHTYLQALLGDMTKAGKTESYLREIAQAILQKRHEPVDWLMLSQESGIGSHHTAKDYVETLEAFFVLRVVHALRSLGGEEISFRKRKKIYISDPLVYSLLSAWIRGEIEPYKEALRMTEDTHYKSRLVENIVGIHLSQAFANIAYWRNRGEIDFIGLGGRRVPKYYEVKYQEKIVSGDKKQLKKVNGSVIISKKTLAYDEKNEIATVPAHLFLTVS